MANRAKQLDALEGAGPGVGLIKDKRLNTLADKFVDTRDEKAKLAKEITKIEGQIIDRMKELKIEIYRFSDQEVRIKPGAEHVKVKTVKVDDSSEEGEGEAGNE